MTCSVPDCGRTAACRRWCAAHYKRWQLTGDVQAGVPIAGWHRGGRCAAPGCQRRTNAKGLCGAHYMQAKAGREFSAIGPRGRRSRVHEVIAEVEWLRTSCSMDEIACRLGYKNRGSLERILQRAGRYDLAARKAA